MDVGQPKEGLPRTSNDLPLVVDLDGTLLRTDLLHESALRLITQTPTTALLMGFWLLKGRAYMKRRIAESARLDFTLLPINEDLVEWLRSEKVLGRRLVLATASDQKLAERAVGHLRLFDDVLGSDGKRNLKSANKLVAIVQCCGAQFDYVGNSHADLAVWKRSRGAILANASRSVEARARQYATVTRIIGPPRNRLTATVRSLRLYQWVKNILIFVPAFTSHSIFQWPILAKSAIACLAFCLCASGVYIANDLVGLEEDRHHSRKRNRPFASGQASLLAGVVVAAGCLIASLSMAAIMGTKFLAVLLSYICVTTYYSLYLKRILLLDVMTLALLYTARIIVGHVVTGIHFSLWLLSFAFFLFLSLAFSKRAAELVKLRESGGAAIPGRDYQITDLQVITTTGICSGFLSSVVLALYINSDAVTLLYRRPTVLWAILPLLLYYITRIWVVCGRSELDDDPIIYTAKSPSTYYIAAVVVLIVIAATVSVP